jgi:hypothetical protein
MLQPHQRKALEPTLPIPPKHRLRKTEKRTHQAFMLGEFLLYHAYTGTVLPFTYEVGFSIILVASL